MSNLSEAVKKRVRERANFRCEYCLMPAYERGRYSKHQVDHIKPRKHGGGDEIDNLALACTRCNRAKGSDFAAEDPKTQTLSYFFNPRTQVWQDHFTLEDAVIIPLTVEARATVSIFRFNDKARVQERKLYIQAGAYHVMLE